MCLDDPPQITLPGFNNSNISDRKLPGELYDGDTQCEFIYGAGWQRCQPLKASLARVVLSLCQLSRIEIESG